VTSTPGSSVRTRALCRLPSRKTAAGTRVARRQPDVEALHQAGCRSCSQAADDPSSVGRLDEVPSREGGVLIPAGRAEVPGRGSSRSRWCVAAPRSRGRGAATWCAHSSQSMRLPDALRSTVMPGASMTAHGSRVGGWIGGWWHQWRCPWRAAPAARRASGSRDAPPAHAVRRRPERAAARLRRGRNRAADECGDSGCHERTVAAQREANVNRASAAARARAASRRRHVRLGTRPSGGRAPLGNGAIAAGWTVESPARRPSARADAPLRERRARPHRPSPGRWFRSRALT